MTSQHTILHIDGDAFFASCEQSRDPRLKGKPVVTGKERGIASSLSYEAKARGVVRGMSLVEIKALCPDVVVLPSDYETYSVLSHRFFTIVRRYTSEVEEYGIDECFADISRMEKVHGMDPVIAAKALQADLLRELGFTFSIGVGPNKVIAKMGSKWRKPFGLTVITLDVLHRYLEQIECAKLWGIGPSTSAYLARYGITTALQFAKQELSWIKFHLHKPFYEIWRELQGDFVLPLLTDEKKSYDSIQKVKTFTPPSRDIDFLLAQLSKNIENACIKSRRYNLIAREAIIFLRTQDFRDFSEKIILPYPSAFPQDIVRTCRPLLQRLFSAQLSYRATGITLNKLIKDGGGQRDLFGTFHYKERMDRLYSGIDAISKKYGKYTVHLASSMQTGKQVQHRGSRADQPERSRELFKGETTRRRIGIPMFLGTVR